MVVVCGSGNGSGSGGRGSGGMCVWEGGEEGRGGGAGRDREKGSANLVQTSCRMECPMIAMITSIVASPYLLRSTPQQKNSFGHDGIGPPQN